YYVKYKNIVDGSGNVNNEDFKIDETVNGFIEIQLSTEIKEKEGSYRSDKYLLPITVTSKKMTELESFKNSFKKEVEKQDRDTINLDTISLPTIVNNFKIRYRDKLDLSFLLLPVLGILMVILLEAKDKEEENEKRKRRQRLLEMDFAQIISKILLYVSSGMTIRNSLIRLAEQYQVKKSKEEKFEERVAYEELVIVKNKLTSGYSEVRAYEEMAKNINLRTYTRFLNIIIQSIKNGNKELKNILNVEVQDALYERKQNAKKLGEEAATKLVLPLMMMLAVIMVVIMVPAFMGM
ncbi:MAG: type II secretion system F family protein, partial [Lachnospiraceae bacterium]|nr:type II secretion system F family protein [Lachnospiraceae bacterium]